MEEKTPQIIEAHCPTCDADRRCDVHAIIDKEWTWDDGEHSANGSHKHSMLECRGCETVFYEKRSWSTEDMDYYYNQNGEPKTHKTTYPRPSSKTRPLWTDQIYARDMQLGRILEQTYEAFDAQSYILAAIGLRTTFDRASEVLEVDASLSFARKLTALKESGMIGEKEREVLAVVVDGGSAAAHRAHSFNGKQLAELFAAMEVFLQRAFIVGSKALDLQDSIPPRP